MMEHVEVMRRIGIEVLEKKIPRNRGILDDQNVVIVIEDRPTDVASQPFTLPPFVLRENNFLR